MRARNVAIALCGFAAAISCARGKGEPAPPPRVVMITPSEALAAGEYRGAEDFVRDFSMKGAAGEGSHAILPPVPKEKPESAVSAFVESAARDPRVAAVVVDPAPRGTAEGFRRAKAARSGASILCVAGHPSDDRLDIESAADLVVDLDRAYRAYIIAWAAKKMGARSLVAVYAPAEASDPDAAREKSIMSAAAQGLGLRFASYAVPLGLDPAALARGGSPPWMLDFGPDAALYCSSPGLVGPLIEGAIQGYGMIVEAAGETSRLAYASAMGLDLSPAQGAPEKELVLLEAKVADLGLGGRLGLWQTGYAEASARGLGEFAMRVSTGAAKKDELGDLSAALDARSGGAAWIVSYDVDPASGVRASNRLLLRQDVYVLGAGYLQSALQAVPSKYLLAAQPGP